MLVTVLLSHFLLIVFFSFHTFHCLAVYTITSSTPLFVNETLVSSNQTFELGFFSPGVTGHLYVGMWYKNISPTKIIWVANREKAVMSAEEAASLRIRTDGNLQLVDGRRDTVWSTNVTVNSNNSLVELLDNGNLVLKDMNSGSIVWESFEHPCDALLPGMKLGMNARTGEKRYLVSWKSDNDPVPGDFVLGITAEVPPQAIGWNKSLPYCRSGQWDKSKFIGLEVMDGTYTSVFTLEQDPNQGTYLTMGEFPASLTAALLISSNGTLKLVFWVNSKKEWLTNWEAPLSLCDSYGTCGPFGICTASNSPICSCLKGFVPKSYEEWNKGDWSGGCIRQTTLNCPRSTNTSSTKDKFRKMSNVKLPDLANYLPYIVDQKECQNRCLDNCSCQAYSYVDSIGCMIWTNPLIDMEKFNSSGEDLFIRLAHTDSGGAKAREKLIFSFMAVLIVIIMGVVAHCLWKRRATQKHKVINKKEQLQQEKSLGNESGLPLFSLDSILAATENFNVTQKLGQGGFGPVYRGKLEDGRDVAVKRLSSNSLQGMEEFKNEIILISELQHRNLIKLVGCCIEGEEKILIYEFLPNILIYEFLPNKSLDTFLFVNSVLIALYLTVSMNLYIFLHTNASQSYLLSGLLLDSTRKTELNWDKRFNIIQGIARGLIYLHSDSCLRVIHRDLKVSNILLDQNMNPKISDFGLARMFQGTQVLVNTHKVVGTLGYMSPEYAMGGMFSEKSDVYSFGVLLLEIIAGKKNSLFHKQGESLNLVFYAWQLWNQGRGLELVDETLVGNSSTLEVMKCIHIGLLCVQDHITDRPNMSTVVLMLSGESDLPQPKQPTFTSHIWRENEIQINEECTRASNAITNSLIAGR